MRGKAHPAELKVKGQAALMAGAEVATVAADLNVSERTVYDWRTDIQQYLASVREDKKGIIEKLLLDSVIIEQKALQDIAMTVSRPEYVMQQSAGDMANLFGVMSDKNVRKGIVFLRLQEAVAAKDVDTSQQPA